MSEEKNKVVIGPGTEYEKVVYLNKPKGRAAREMMPKVLKFMNGLASVQKSEAGGLSEVVDIISAFWDYKEFEDVLVPYVLQLNDPKGREYLDTECTSADILDAFTKAAQFLIDESFNKKEVQEALGK